MHIINALRRTPVVASGEQPSNGAGPSRPDAYTALVFSDLHGKPLYPQILAAVREHQPRVVAFIGDLISADTFSTFLREQDADYAQEYAAVQNVIGDVAALVEKVLLAYGNHERRVFTWFMGRGARGDMLSAQERALTMNWLPLDTIASQFANVEVSNLHYDYHTPGGLTFEQQFTSRHIVHVGNAYLGHPRIAKKNPAASVMEWRVRLDEWRRPLDLPEGALYAMGHTHGGGWWARNGGHVILAETGCALTPSTMQYVWDNQQGSGTNSPVLGYLSFEMRGEKVNPCAVQFHLL